MGELREVNVSRNVSQRIEGDSYVTSGLVPLRKAVAYPLASHGDKGGNQRRQPERDRGAGGGARATFSTRG